MTTTKEISIGDIASRGSEAVNKIEGDRMALNVGPSHPTTHGVLRLIMELDGDLINKCEPVLGYLHRGDEKIAENMTYNQFVPYTDRLDYLAPLANNVAYALTVEKLAKESTEHLQIIAPGFSSDCLETIEELDGENREIFEEHGGKKFSYIPCLNKQPDHINLIAHLIKNELQGWV